MGKRACSSSQRAGMGLWNHRQARLDAKETHGVSRIAMHGMARTGKSQDTSNRYPILQRPNGSDVTRPSNKIEGSITTL